MAHSLEHREVVVVGGGPAGSSAAWELERSGVDCLVLDRDAFPRHKLCAGWVTPEVLTDLEISENDYPHGLLTFDALAIKLKGFPVRVATRQHSIRRVEFDAWLLERSGAEVRQHTVKDVVQTEEGFELDGLLTCRYLIGAGGTRCPVHRSLVRPIHPRAKALQCVTLELEYEHDWCDGDCHLWFGDGGLPGYAWYVPKARGFLNIGVGGTVEKLALKHDSIRRHWDALVDRLTDEGLMSEPPPEPTGYSYYLRDKPDCRRLGNAFVVGDSAGLATRDMCEGIGPAVRSGLLAARSIQEDRDHGLSGIDPFTLQQPLAGRALQRLLVPRGMRL